jgi:hypothetical protein
MDRHPNSPHIRSYNGDLRDYNGIGDWSVEGVQARYREYAELLRVEEPCLPVPREHRNGLVQWIFPIMDEIIKGIERGDAACIAIGVDFVEQHDLFAFGKILKSNTARALRRSSLTEEQKSRLRTHIVTMLVSGIVPHEMREYSKLLRVIGVEDQWPRLEQGIPANNPYAMRFYRTLRTAANLPVESK